jgi:5'(3')-deoxyribonucleotidase
MNIGLFDMDGSLTDYEGQLTADLQKLMSPEEKSCYKGVSVWKLEEHPHFRNRIRMIKAQTNWWLNLPEIRLGLGVLNIAQEIGFDIHILTKGPKWHPQAWKEKVEWCQKRFGRNIDIHITSDKGIVYGKFLYDDYPEYMFRWLKFRPRGLGIMPVNDNNRDFEHPQVIKFDGNNYDVVEDALKTCYNRKVGCR